MTENLPVLATRIGGSLVDVLKWEQHALLPQEVKYAISKFVQQNPELNTIQRVDFLADLASFHGQTLDKDIARLISIYKVETVYFAVDYLYESGERTKSEHDFKDIEKLLDVILKLQQAGAEFNSNSELDELINQVGSIDEASELSVSEIAKILLAIRNEGVVSGEDYESYSNTEEMEDY